MFRGQKTIYIILGIIFISSFFVFSSLSVLANEGSFNFNDKLSKFKVPEPVEITGATPQGAIDLTVPQLPTMDLGARLELGRVTENQGYQITADDRRSKLVQLFQDNLAGAWKAMLHEFAQQFAYDTATWIASGGKGQQPLFVTEGWGSYLKNTADNAAGAFISDLDDQFGVNLCEPDFDTKLLIKTSLSGMYGGSRRPPSCNFSKMADNWQSAISNPNFTIDYRNYLNSNENEIGIFLTTQSDLLSKVKKEESQTLLKLVSSEGWLDKVDFAGKVLTPGSMVFEKWGHSVEDANGAWETFTGTVWDFIGPFLDTLVGKLLQNLQTGFFSSDSGSRGSSGLGGFNLSNLLNNPEASPYIEGSVGSKDRFANLIESEMNIGGAYDILNKLVSCSESAKTNPSPTDCVIDHLFAQQIREKALIKDLPDSILNRPFVPSVNEVTNPQEAFTLRNILILRKYRIVPVGWEIAARYIHQYTDSDNKVYTLRDMINLFGDATSDFSGLVDPHWVLKAPELFCRRTGFGEHDMFATTQNQSLRRSEYCADEQQCIREDGDGNCLAYGYCTEEERIWDLNSKTCDPRFNTCQTYQSRTGSSASYLGNTLDYRNCNSQNVGCRWYSAFYNTVDGFWTSIDNSNRLKVCDNPDGCDAFGKIVPKWEQVEIDSNGGTILATACTQEGGCNYSAKTCTVPDGGVKCSLDVCLSDFDRLVSLNGGFETQDTASWDARNWQEAYQNDSNRHFRSEITGRTGNYSLQSASLNNSTPLITTLPNINGGIDVQQDYVLKFYVRGTSSSGRVLVDIYSGASNLGGVSINNFGIAWREYTINFNSQDSESIELRITTDTGTFGNIYFDDFELRQIESDCEDSNVWLVLGSQPDDNSDIYFDRDVQTCNSSAVGCSQFIRTKAGLGSNMIRNGSFDANTNSDEIPDSWSSDGIAWDGDKIKNGYLGADLGAEHIFQKVILTPNSYYSISIDASQVDVGLISMARIPINLCDQGGNCYDGLAEPVSGVGTCELGFGGHITSANLRFTPVGINMERGNCWFKTNENTVAADIYIQSNSASSGELWFDNIKLERVDPENTNPTPYSAYNPSQRPENQLAYLKKAPNYYDCYLDPNTQKWPTNTDELQRVLDNRDSSCSNYSGVCIPSEMNCELYTPTNNDPAVPGTITSADVCPLECVGYQVYKQEQTSFTSSKYEQFINKPPIQYCSASTVGCDEFTNLDEVERGGEALEYYSRFRVCQKPEVGDGATYYTWEGSDTTGYQLKVFDLKKSKTAVAGTIPPCTNLRYDDGGNAICEDPAPSDDPDINSGACLSADMQSNPDCREFYDTNGNIHYRLLSRVIYVSNDCHPYRRTQTQNTIAEAMLDCQNSSGYFNSFNECIYMAIPSQSRVCSASAVGCREYTGNRGNSFANIFVSDFESGSDGWQGGIIVSEATYPGGNSLSNSITPTVTTKKLSKNVFIRNNQTYYLSFWAKGSEDFNLDSVSFNDAPAEDSFLRGVSDIISDISIPITSEWQRYELGPVFVSWGNTIGYFEKSLDFNIPDDKSIYIDSVVLKELPQSVFAIENSWFTPFVCDNKIDNPYGGGDLLNPIRLDLDEMLGCQQYKDRSSQIWNLKSFESLCRAEAVGCEELIDTYNSDSFNAKPYNEGDISQIDIPQDSLVYMVNSSRYTCNSVDKGCSAFGLPTINSYDEVVGYSTRYLKNQPDRYATDLCSDDELWCEEFSGSRSLSYFKDPRNKICEYRTLSGENENKWYKRGTDQLCDVTNFQTLNKKGVQPIGWFNSYEYPDPYSWFDINDPSVYKTYDGWVGSCPADESSCTEYIDPLADFYTNEIYNSDQWQDVNGDSIPDGWEEDGSNYKQTLNLPVNTLFTFSISENANSAYLILACSSGKFVSPDLSANINDSVLEIAPGAKSARFYIASYDDSNCDVNLFISQLHPDKLIIAKSGLYYALANKVNYNGCDGLVDYNTGCVLFNDRGAIDYLSENTEIRNRGYLVFDADKTYAEQLLAEGLAQRPYVAQINEQKNSNVVLKVSPDRQCASWLYCTTYEKGDINDPDPIYGNKDKCLDIGLCSSVDEKGECDRLLIGSANPVPEMYGDNKANKTGYASVGKTFGSNKVSGYYPYDLMSQFGSSGVITNGNFESVGDNGYPIGWSPIDILEPTVNLRAYKQPIGWDTYKFVSIADSSLSKEGARYLQLNSFYEAKSDEIDVLGEKPYILSGWVNTESLEHPISTVVEGQIQYREYDGTNNAWGAWVIPEELKLYSGLPWAKLMHEFTTGINTVKLEIRLKNYVETNKGACVDENPATDHLCEDCDDYDKETRCDLGGYTLFDDISLKPVLEVSNSSDITEKYIPRTCRIYPSDDALSCSYMYGNNFFYGQYGYCLLSDPENPNQCLQWWPIDQLEGEMTDEVGGYADRIPLDYCIASSTMPINFSDTDLTIELTDDLADLGGTLGISSSQGLKFHPAKVDDEYRPLFRFPYVYEFEIETWATGGSELGFGGMLPTTHYMVYNVDKRQWEPFIYIPICYNTGLFYICTAVDLTGIGDFIDGLIQGVGEIAGDGDVNPDGEVTPIDGNTSAITNLPPVIDWDTAASGGYSVIFSTLNELAQTIGIQFGPVVGVRVIEDTQRISGATDPIPDLPGDILGYQTFVQMPTVGDVDDTNVLDALVVSIKIDTEFDVSYCNKFTRVVNTSGSNKAYTNRVKAGSGFINTDTASRDEDRYYYNDPFDYNLFIDSIEDEPQYAVSATNLTFFEDIATFLLPFFPNLPRDTQSPLKDSTYQSSDYKPFGALVATDPTSDPGNWTSRKGISQMPLFYEPPRIGAFEPPYQARMGEEHTIEGLEQLFAKSYGNWQWSWWDVNNKSRGGKYMKYDPNDDEELTIPPDECNIPDGTLDRNKADEQPCFITPLVVNVKINDEPSATINNGIGLAKLEFNTNVDPDQLPITAYEIDWGDGDSFRVSGITLRNRVNEDNPFVLYHLYDFWKLSRFESSCIGQDHCNANVIIKIWDNWGKESDPTNINVRVNK